LIHLLLVCDVFKLHHISEWRELIAVGLASKDDGRRYDMFDDEVGVVPQNTLGANAWV